MELGIVLHPVSPTEDDKILTEHVTQLFEDSEKYMTAGEWGV